MFKLIDDEGIYYWHKPTGTVTRTEPSKEDNTVQETYLSTTSSQISESLGRSQTSSSLDIEFNFNHTCEMNVLQASPNHQNETSKEQNITKRFLVNSLGWIQINEELTTTQETSAKILNKCLNELTRSKNDSIARWGNGKDLYMDIDDKNMSLINPFDDKVLVVQPIVSIKVWGVGRDCSSQDFAYVARDNLTKTYKCHVYRSEGIPAKEIANSLKKVLDNQHKTKKEQSLNSSSIDEQKKMIRCLYIGSVHVLKPNGINILNDAINKIYRDSVYRYYEDLAPVDEDSIDLDDIDDNVKDSKWHLVSLTITPSNILAIKLDENEIIFDCRLRYLAFMGISTINTKICALIVHNSDNTFTCHAFYNEPSAGPLCKTIEAACKLRYQKCLDAHPEAALNSNSNSSSSNLIGNTLNNIFSFIKNKSLKR